MPTPASFSIIIPTRNRASQIDRLLVSLSQLDYPRDRFEVIVVDDGGQPPLSLHTGVATIVRQPAFGPAAARNGGARAARGDLLVFLDDDCTPPPDWLRRLDEACTAHPGCAIGSETHNGLPGNPYSAASHLLHRCFMRLQNPERVTFLPSNALAVPASRFRDVGGFDGAFGRAAGEDRDFCARWIARGWRLVETPGICVAHCHPQSFAGFIRKHFEYGRAALRHHKAAAAPRAGPVFVLDAVRRAFCEASGARALGLASLAVLSQAATFAGYLRERISPPRA